MSHAVARLREERLQRSLRGPRARGARCVRCAGCRLPEPHCLCAERPVAGAHAGVALVMHDAEPLKPTNTGWLVADVVADTHAFGWSRTCPDARLQALLDDPGREPLLVFPARYADPSRVARDWRPDPRRRPLFVLLDATWREARRMYRHSPSLDPLPVLDVPVERASRYHLRHARRDDHLCSAEVVALCLRRAGEEEAACRLEDWLERFVARYLVARGQPGGQAPITP